MVNIIKPWLWIPPHWAHALGPYFLKVYGHYKPLQTLTWSPFTWKQLEFTNPLGTAGGVDKNGDCLDGWWSFGAGFVEIGTVTPLPQKANDGPKIKRNLKSKAVWNRLGFPSLGLDSLVSRLTPLYQPYFTPLFINIGKNRETPNEKAHEDYCLCLKKLNGLADVFVINISSPNTEGLRELLLPQNLKSFLEPIVKTNKALTELRNSSQDTPLLLKISPDISENELEKIIEISLDLEIDGWILTNTSKELGTDLGFPTEGGVSGLPLAQKSKDLLRHTISVLGSSRQGKLIVSTGGIITPEDVLERLTMGADLVQVYSALILNGPLFFRQVAEKASLDLNIKS